MNKTWREKTYNSKTCKELENALKIHPIFCKLLAQRGINNFEAAKEFFRPSLDKLHDPFLMKDMERAIDRIEYALKRQEKLIIYGDYDVDGTTSVALVYSFLSNYFDNIEYYIPDRYKEGYGVSMQVVDYAIENEITLIITLDCGVTNIEQVQYAKDHEIHFIICDHHLPKEQLPPARAILNPKRPDCSYPYKELSGCGVGFKLLQAFCIKKQISQEKLFSKLDLVAISIGCDIVQVTGENRILAFHGLEVLNSQPRKGLDIILESAGVKRINEETGEITYQKIDLTDTIFKIGPKINAAGRIGDAKDAVKMLIAKDNFNGENFGQLLLDRNQERLEHDARMTQEALEIMKASEYKNRKSTVIYKEDWHKGVIGIVASRVIETHYKPTILLTLSDGKATGSARSVQGFDVHAAINACSDLLINFGGHKYAAGLTLAPENVSAFIERFEYAVASTIKPEQLIPEIEVDSEIQLSLITPKFYSILSQMGPFGPGNLRPVFVTDNLQDNGYSKVVGKTHLKTGVIDPKSGKTMNGIAFGMGNRLHDICSKKNIKMAYSLSENHWKGKSTIQMDVKDIKTN